MLTRRDRGWSIVRESLRRERRISDLLNASNAARLSRRVAVAGDDRSDWPEAEAVIRRIEHNIRRLDPVGLDFWVRYQQLEQDLVAAFGSAGVVFRPR